MGLMLGTGFSQFIDLTFAHSGVSVVLLLSAGGVWECFNQTSPFPNPLPLPILGEGGGARRAGLGEVRW